MFGSIIEMKRQLKNIAVMKKVLDLDLRSQLMISIAKTNLQTVRPGEPGFTITDGITVAQRAGFEISRSCPAEYKSIFITAINAGWLKPVATIYKRDLTFQTLKESK